jgi:hypothetical protein
MDGFEDMTDFDACLGHGCRQGNQDALRD